MIIEFLINNKYNNVVSFILWNSANMQPKVMNIDFWNGLFELLLINLKSLKAMIDHD